MKYNYSNLVISILILAAAGYIYDKFKINIDSNTQQEDLNIIKKYLLDEINSSNSSLNLGTAVFANEIDYGLQSINSSMI